LEDEDELELISEEEELLEDFATLEFEETCEVWQEASNAAVAKKTTDLMCFIIVIIP
jgi:hypothetical protein